MRREQGVSSMRTAPRVLAAALSIGVFVSIQSGPGLANDPNVRVFYPTAAPEVPERLDASAEGRSLKVQVNQLAIVVAYPPCGRHRCDFLGHRYLGFHGVYSGPRYPF
jgi:hypothetical protein